MKHLLLFLLFSGSLDGFSQDGGSGKNDLPTFPSSRTGEVGPAILHTKPGFVVRQLGKEEVYLDDKLRVVKSPLEVFSYKIKK